MTTYLGKSCSFCLPRVPFVNCRQFMYLVISLLVLRAGYGIWLYQFLIIAYLFTFHLLALALSLGRFCHLNLFSDLSFDRSIIFGSFKIGSLFLHVSSPMLFATFLKWMTIKSKTSWYCCVASVANLLPMVSWEASITRLVQLWFDCRLRLKTEN